MLQINVNIIEDRKHHSQFSKISAIDFWLQDKYKLNQGNSIF